MLYGGTPSADDLLSKAVALRYTNNGEMFSALWLLEVLKENLPRSGIKPDKIRSYIFDGPLDSDFIKEKLQQHSMLLVPYDADRNHSPCNQNGHKAHWCLICGYLVEDNNDVSREQAKSEQELFIAAKFSRNYFQFPFRERLIQVNSLTCAEFFILLSRLILVSRFCTTWKDEEPRTVLAEGLE